MFVGWWERVDYLCIFWWFIIICLGRFGSVLCLIGLSLFLSLFIINLVILILMHICLSRNQGITIFTSTINSRRIRALYCFFIGFHLVLDSGLLVLFHHGKGSAFCWNLYAHGELLELRCNLESRVMKGLMVMRASLLLELIRMVRPLLTLAFLPVYLVEILLACPLLPEVSNSDLMILWLDLL